MDDAIDYKKVKKAIQANRAYMVGDQDPPNMIYITDIDTQGMVHFLNIPFNQEDQPQTASFRYLSQDIAQASLRHSRNLITTYDDIKGLGIDAEDLVIEAQKLKDITKGIAPQAEPQEDYQLWSAQVSINPRFQPQTMVQDEMEGELYDPSDPAKPLRILNASGSLKDLGRYRYETVVIGLNDLKEMEDSGYLRIENFEPAPSSPTAKKTSRHDRKNRSREMSL